jgi:hypothetical protein
VVWLIRRPHGDRLSVVRPGRGRDGPSLRQCRGSQTAGGTPPPPPSSAAVRGESGGAGAAPAARPLSAREG